ncbi:MAG: endonuclease III [Candidatus Zixiibacteriota bacterium]|nr:MAG: endonuclease III [candidate division Zixibacteria bacterium]
MPRESLKEKQQRAEKVVRLLKKAYPDSRCTLNYRTVHQLLVATILSAQCTDERVNMVTPKLFKRFRSVKEFAEADLQELQELIYTTGFYVNKAKAIKHSARQLLDRHGGKVPKDLTDLVKLQGVGRKTASAVLGAGYDLAEGVVVDTHVSRISRLLRFTAEKSPVKIEQDLMKVIPRPDWIVFTHMMIDHGRAVCIARRPKCGECVLTKQCPSALYER